MNLGKGEGKSFWLLTDLFTFKLMGSDTGGALTLAELTAQPKLGPPPHSHRDNDESFFILEGTFDFSLAGKAFTASPGAFVHLPKGVVHTHTASSATPAKALVFQSPAGVERFIQEAGRPAMDTSATPNLPERAELERVVGIARKHGIDVPPA